MNIAYDFNIKEVENRKVQVTVFRDKNISVLKVFDTMDEALKFISLFNERIAFKEKMNDM